MVFFQKKNDRAMNWLKEQNDKELEKPDDAAPYSPDEFSEDQKAENTADEDTIKEKHKSHKNNKKGMEIEKHDMSALTLAAFLVFMPIAILILGLFALISWLFF
ncbi:hypothetical protein [Anaerocolumna xylanovorans]|uniref:Uncharacterized protein n=1 Tax=Anaerocolumna xylanovorans DSM 12503 TaxID=1121345 RepID=A0A1M7YJ50_9FIRM|nr:hypothetical protein [Anaerocolumna xylanovorans]SHO52629.1 hypothetical protein SAMN02745217_03753 [Anaerocolumna xylanovorans DSM 12503]